MSPRVLFVSRERFTLPLDGVQRRKWDAVAEALDVRILAAAAPGSPTHDGRFRLSAPAPVLDGALYYLRLPARVARELRAFEPDVVFVQGVHEALACLVGRRLASRAPKVVLDLQGDWRGATRFYGSGLRRLLNPLNDALGPRAVRSVDAVRTISTETTRLVRELGVEPAGTFPPYVDAEAFVRSEPAPLPQVPGALFVGALERVKAFDTLTAAWRLAAPRLAGARLRIVGTGSLEPLAEALVRELPGRVDWERRLPADEVAAAMDDAWVVCLPSRSEGLGRVAVEAMCRGRAVVGSAGTGIAEVVEDGRNGLLVEPGRPAELGEALARVLLDRGLAERLGRAARETGEEWIVTPSEYAERLRTLVEACASRSSSS